MRPKLILCVCIQQGSRREWGGGVISPRARCGWYQVAMENKEKVTEGLTKIFAAFLATADVPENRRIANVVVLFKKGSRD